MNFLFGSADAEDSLTEESRVESLKGPVQVGKN
jgi:hypothetical protein